MVSASSVGISLVAGPKSVRHQLSLISPLSASGRPSSHPTSLSGSTYGSCRSAKDVSGGRVACKSGQNIGCRGKPPQPPCEVAPERQAGKGSLRSRAHLLPGGKVGDVDVDLVGQHGLLEHQREHVGQVREAAGEGGEGDDDAEVQGWVRDQRAVEAGRTPPPPFRHVGRGLQDGVDGVDAVRAADRRAVPARAQCGVSRERQTPFLCPREPFLRWRWKQKQSPQHLVQLGSLPEDEAEYSAEHQLCARARTARRTSPGERRAGPAPPRR